jgi:hypothetical protein
LSRKRRARVFVRHPKIQPEAANFLIFLSGGAILLMKAMRFIKVFAIKE